MTQENIEKEMAEAAGITKEQANIALNKTLEIIQREIGQDGGIRIYNLGRFSSAWSKERIGRNPKTGEAITIAAKWRLKFTPAKRLKEAVAALPPFEG